MKNICTILAAGALFALPCSAQTVKSGYFLDNYPYAYRVNPSLMIEKSFAAFGFGSIDAGIASDLGVSSFIYPNEAGNGLVTAFHPCISSETFLGNLKDINSFEFNLNYNLLTLGIRTKSVMVNLEVNMRNDMSISVPKGLFAFIKSGSSATAYDFSGLGVSDKAVLELALGVAKKSGNLTIGGRAKALLGGAAANAGLSKALVTVNGSEVSADVEADSYLANNAVNISIGQSGGTLDIPDLSTIDINSAEFAGMGAAVDLGLSWAPVEYLTVTAGVNDLGFMKWKYNMNGHSAGNVSFTGLEDVNLSGASEDVGAEFENLYNDVAKIADFKFSKGDFTVSEPTPFSLNAGFRARFPFTRIISVGALATLQPGIDFKEVRAGASFTPTPFLSVSANIGKNSYGKVCGFGASMTLLGINFFAAIDSYSGRIASISLPDVGVTSFGYKSLSLPIDPFRYRANFGITLQMIGRRHY